jgi:geranylgeranyl pyrophosphate synthase
LPVLKLIDTLDDSEKLKILEIFMEEMTAIHIGQGWDIEMQVNKRLPYIDDYRNTVLFKTGVFPRFLVKTIFALYEGENKERIKHIKEELIKVSDYLSIAFQIKDDLLNITDSNVANSKGVLGEDIFEGKYTLMVIHSLENKFDNSARLNEILNLKTKDPILIKEAIEILKVNKSIEFANKMMNDSTSQALACCKNLRESKSGSSELVDSSVTRDIQDLLLLLVNI